MGPQSGAVFGGVILCFTRKNDIPPCYFGVDLPTWEELIATGRSVEEIREKIHATTLAYIDEKKLVEAVGLPAEDLCMACATGDYPYKIPCETCTCRKIYRK